MNIHINDKPNRIKWTNLCRREITFWENQGSLKEHEQEIKVCMENSTGNAGKKSTKAGKNDKTKEKRCNMLEQKGKGNTRKNNNNCSFFLTPSEL